jgi:hypothetical protein
MVLRRSTWLVAIPVFGLACPKEPPTPPAAGAPAAEIALAGAAVMVGAGDIAMCGSGGDEATAALVDSILKADSAANVPNAVFTMGDNAYPSGPRGYDDFFVRCLTPSWVNKARSIMKWIHPTPGNLDFEVRSGDGYYKYFGDRAGPSGKGYYSYDLGDWHVIALNSELPVGSVADGGQNDWLRKDLKDHSKKCTLAYFHKPLFSSGTHGASGQVADLWTILYEAGVDLVVNGHEHDYERFDPQTPAGLPDTLRGITQIIVGTGGADLRGINEQPEPNSASRIHGYFGVLKLTLGDGEYRHAFLDTQGRIWDQGGGKCH